jgi:hypothetical protein
MAHIKLNYLKNIFTKSETIKHLQEQLIPAQIHELTAAMSVDKGLYNFLTRKAKNLPREYLSLVQELTKDVENKTLLDVIKTGLTWNIRGTKTKCLFSKAGNKLLGFAAYIVRRNEVIEIKMFSFNPKRQRPVLIRELKELLKQLLQQYNKISWSAMEKNPANRIYQEAINEFDGSKVIENGIVYYYINRNEMQ